MLVVAYDDAQILDVACSSATFEIANEYRASPPYAIELASATGRPVRSSSGIGLTGARRLASVTGRIDTMVVVGGHGTQTAMTDAGLLTQLRRLAPCCRRIASVCTGAFLLAAAGLLDGRRATTHWNYSDLMASVFPAVTVDPAPLYVRDGNIYTSAGVTSALDLTLALIEDDHGPTLAREVAREMVTYLHRPADQAQISTFLAPPPGDRVVRDLAGYIAAHLAEDLSPPALAARAGISTRHLTRLFRTQWGVTPARAVRTARTEAAAHLVRGSELSLAAIARRCGFRSAETLRQAFLNHYGMTGDTIRKMADMPLLQSREMPESIEGEGRARKS
nr:DJ-1/PfpI family protein [Amycolatopsis sp. CA-126428]